MDDQQTLIDLSHRIAEAIAARDVDRLASMLAPEFAQRSHAGGVADAAGFLEAIRGIPGEIVVVRVERLAVDVAGGAAMVTGTQHAQLLVDGQAVDDQRAFADFFLKIDGVWKLRAAADFPAAAPA